MQSGTFRTRLNTLIENTEQFKASNDMFKSMQNFNHNPYEKSRSNTRYGKIDEYSDIITRTDDPIQDNSTVQGQSEDQFNDERSDFESVVEGIIQLKVKAPEDAQSEATYNFN